MATTLRCFLHPCLPPIAKPFFTSTLSFTRRQNASQSSLPFFSKRRKSSHALSFQSTNVSTHSAPNLFDLGDVLKGYMFGQKKATDVAHLVWKLVVQKGDIVVDAICGNGNDTLTLAKLVTDDLEKGCVYGIDVQKDAIKNTSSFLDLSLDANQRKSVKLLSVCHSKMMEALVWKLVVQKGDIVVDATCGNGNDTLALAKLVTDDLEKGCVYGIDVQKDAIKNTSSFLDLSLDANQRNSVKLLSVCHSKMMEALPENSSVRLVAFNLGYLPGGDKEIITKSDTTLMALEAAKELLLPGGVISVVAYVGHSGGREEYETVRDFASQLPAEYWACSHIQMLNKPLAPILLFFFKR